MSSALLSILFALLCVLCTTGAQPISGSGSTTATSSTYIEESFDFLDSNRFSSLTTQAASNGEAKNIIGGVLACIALISLVGGCSVYLVYKRYSKKRAALDAKAASSDSISEAKTLV